VSGAPVISLRNIGVAYVRARRLRHADRFWALRDISFDVHRGEVLGIVGRNGAGKSTLLQILADIIRPDCGIVQREPVRASLLSIRLGFVPHLPGRENAILMGMLLGYRRADIVARLDEIVDFAELAEFIDQPVKTYSSGMRARLGFSVAFQLDPDVLLVDEVLGVGDAAFRRKSAEAMRKKIRSGRTAVLVSHDERTVKRLCHRAVWIDRGSVMMEGSTAEVLEAYSKSTAMSPLEVPEPDRTGHSL
jgi:lipopolysaccharide transport system ATP-binding protein